MPLQATLVPQFAVRQLLLYTSLFIPGTLITWQRQGVW